MAAAVNRLGLARSPVGRFTAAAMPVRCQRRRDGAERSKTEMAGSAAGGGGQQRTSVAYVFRSVCSCDRRPWMAAVEVET
jgi:hypothetical protein